MKFGLCLALLFGNVAAFADNVTLPHTFQAGTKALASDVNDNFKEIKRAVDDNDQRISAGFFFENFDAAILRPTWSVDAGNWTQANGVLTNPSGSMGHIHASGMTPKADVQIETTLSFANGADAGIYFSLSDAGGYLWLFRNQQGTTDSVVFPVTGYGKSDNSNITTGTQLCSQNHAPYLQTTVSLRLTVAGKRVDAWVNGTRIMDNCLLPNDAPPGRIGLYAYKGVGNQSFDELRVTPIVRQNIAEALSGAISYTTANYTGTQFATNVTGAVNMCPTGTHVCNAWEYSVITILGQDQVDNSKQAWIIGGFPNSDIHIRSLVNGQDSLVCGTTSATTTYLSAYGTYAANPTGKYFGRLHCIAATSSQPVACCRANLLGGLQ